MGGVRRHQRRAGIAVLAWMITAGCTATRGPVEPTANATPAKAQPDPLAEVRHEAAWADVAPVPLPDGLPLMGPEGTDAFGYPTRVVDRAALRSLLVHRQFARLTQVVEELQTQFEKDFRFEDRIRDAYDALGLPHRRERELIDGWLKATPASFAPHLASALYWVNTGFLWRGTRYARQTSTGELSSMEEALARARTDLETALKLRPRLQEAQLWLITIEIASGSRESASAIVERVIAQCPGCYQVRESWMWALQARWGGSIEEMQDFVRRRSDPNNPRHRVLRGLLLLEQASDAFDEQRQHDALALIDQACEIGGSWIFFERRASARVQSTGLEPYLADLERANAAHPGVPQVVSERAFAYMNTGRPEEAARDLLYVLRAKPTTGYGNSLLAPFVQALDAQGWKEHLAGRRAAAARLYALARDLAPANEEILAHARAVEAAPADGSQAGQTAPVVGNGRPTLEIAVVDDAGAPVPGARVAVLPGQVSWPMTQQLAAIVFRDGATAGRDGIARVEVQPGPHVVLAVLPKPPLVGAVMNVAVGTTGARSRMAVGGGIEISGHVLDEEGRPAPGMEVLALPDNGRPASESRKVAGGVSGADGAFVVRGVDAQGYVLPLPGSESVIRITTGGATGVALRPQPVAKVRGRVLLSSPGQEPRVAESFTVRFGRTAETLGREAQGRFSIRVPPGSTGALFVTVEGRPAVARTIERLAKSLDLGDVVVGAGRTLRGRVVDPRGYPAQGADVGLRYGPPIARTKSDGTFEMTVPDGPIDLQVFHPEWVPWAQTIPAETRSVEARLAAGAALKLLVTDPGGAPLVGASFQVIGPKAPTCTTGNTGRCTFTGLPAGRYSVLSQAAPTLGPNAAAPPPLTVPVSEDGTLGVWLTWGAEHASLIVHLAEATDPGPWFVIQVLPGTAPRAGADGPPKVPHYTGAPDSPLENLPPGRYTVVALDQRAPATCARSNVVLRAGEERALTLRPVDGGCR